MYCFVGYNKEQHVFLINFNHMTILLKRGVLVALTLLMLVCLIEVFLLLF